MEEETIEVVNSDDGGNGLPTDIAPSLEPKTDTPTEEGKAEDNPPQDNPPTTTETPAQELYELPDGRKVDAETLSREFKENFLPEFTRKSQILAEYERGNKSTNKEPDTVSKPYQDPDWQPQTYAELIELAKQEVKSDLQREQLEVLQKRQAVEDAVAGQLAEIKQVDPNLNENTLFVHATKYGFKDLKLAHQNMKDMALMAEKVRETTAQNIAKRKDPVSIVPGATGNTPSPSNFSTAVDYLRSLGK